MACGVPLPRMLCAEDAHMPCWDTSAEMRVLPRSRLEACMSILGMTVSRKRTGVHLIMVPHIVLEACQASHRDRTGALLLSCPFLGMIASTPLMPAVLWSSTLHLKSQRPGWSAQHGNTICNCTGHCSEHSTTPEWRTGL